MEHRWDVGQITPLAESTPGELLAALARRGETVVRVAAGAASAMTPLTMRGWSVSSSVLDRWPRRVVHEWLHESDIASVDGDVPVPRMAVGDLLISSVLRTIQLQVLPQTQTAAGVVRLVIDPHPSLAEPSDVVPPAHHGRRTWSVDFARRHYGPRVTALPDATVWLHVTGLALLAGGRLSREALESRWLVIDGNADLAWELLDGVAGCASQSTAIGV